MLNFIGNAILWILAIYGLLEILKTIIYIYSCTNLKADGIYIIIAAKNQEDKIEGILRSILFKILYGKEEIIKDIIVTDLDSKDSTKEILNKFQKECNYIKVTNWRECKEIIDSINIGG